MGAVLHRVSFHIGDYAPVDLSLYTRIFNALEISVFLLMAYCTTVKYVKYRVLNV